MKSYGKVFSQITATENLAATLAVAARGKRDSDEVTAHLRVRQTALLHLQRRLQIGSWQPGTFRQFQIRDPKPRTISHGPFEDRVIHHAICRKIGPGLDRQFIFDSYARRACKGSHAASRRARTYCRRFGYYYRFDVRAFFNSVDHQILSDVLLPVFREQALQRMLASIVRHPYPGAASGKGLPIGNLTSQWFANLYLDGLDHLAKNQLRIAGYVRCMDDVVQWSNSKAQLWEWADGLRHFLAQERCLQLKEVACVLAPASEGLAFLGVRIYPGTTRLTGGRRRRALRLCAQRKAEYMGGSIPAEKLARGVQNVAAGITACGARMPLPCEVEL